MIASSATKMATGGRVSRGIVGRRAVASRSAAVRSARWMAPTALRNHVPLMCFYSTERVVELRSGRAKEAQPRTVYDPSRETENCGVGLVASLKSIPSRRVVDDADEMLVRMSHRGGCGCDPASGDGAGKSSCSESLLLQHVSMLTAGAVLLPRYAFWNAGFFHAGKGK